MKKTLTSLITGGIASLAAITISSTVLAWGPQDRPTYTNASPADYATFNSITDNGGETGLGVGDERNFVRIREANTDDNYSDEVVVEAGKEYEVWIYYHNNAGTDTNSSGFGIATNTKVSSSYPVAIKKGDRSMVSGIISWSYVTPEQPDTPQTGKVWDEAYVTTQSEENIVLRYKTGTAILHNGGTANGSVFPSSLFTSAGAVLSYNTNQPGVIPGCAEYSGHITYTLVAENTSTDLKKQVSTDGETWPESNSVSVAPGEYVTYKVTFTNTGNTTLTNAIFTDVHDAGLTLRPGSTKIYDASHADGLVIDDILDISGYNMGNIAPGAMVQIIYQAQVADDTELCGKTLNNSILLSYNSGEGEEASTSSVVVSCSPDCTTNPDLPECQQTCITNPELEGCQELPNTGPLTIALAVLIILGIGGGGYYYYRTHKAIQKVNNEILAGNVENQQMSQAQQMQQGTDSRDSLNQPKGDNV